MKAALLVIVVLVLPRDGLAWLKDCQESYCRIYAHADYAQPHYSEPMRMLLEIRDSEDVLLTALNTRSYHKEFWTTEPPTYIALDGKEYVPSRFLFNKHFPGSLMVDGKRVAMLSVLQQSQLRSSRDDFKVIVGAFKRGSSASVEFVGSLEGKGQRLNFSLVGFTLAVEGLMQRKTLPSASAEVAEPTTLVAPLIVANRFGLTDEDLQVVDNPDGSGSFVYVPEFTYRGVNLKLIWFVRGNTVVKLGGHTHSLTPSLPFPDDLSLDFWYDTGLDESIVIHRGFQLVFGD